MSELVIRAAHACDLDRLGDLVGQSSHAGLDAMRKWVEAGRTLLALQNETVVGFSVTESSFFGNDFVEMLRVSPHARRIGAATQLLTAVSVQRLSDKLFTSTNLSNMPMQGVLKRAGWESVGIVYGLDEGDPELFYKAPSL